MIRRTLLAAVGGGAAFAAGSAFRGARTAASPTLPGAVDIGFARSMSQHHEQAILIANLVQGQGRAGPMIERQAAAIAVMQQLELGMFRGWLLLWDSVGETPGKAMDWISLDGTDIKALGVETLQVLTACRETDRMPGQAQQEELRQLRELRGGPLDRLFLTLMIRHHAGGLPLAMYAGLRASLPQSRALATRMAREQQTELVQMKAMLAMA